MVPGFGGAAEQGCMWGSKAGAGEGFPPRNGGETLAGVGGERGRVGGEHTGQLGRVGGEHTGVHRVGGKQAGARGQGGG